MRLIKSFLIAISMYSRIPVIHMEWKEEDMKYVFVFFPFVGIVIGGLVFAWNLLCNRFEIAEAARICIGAAIPLLISGGIHADGFLDTSDAFSSYRNKEEKINILKNPHIGAFAIIRFALYGLIYIASISLIHDWKLWLLLGISFVLARCLSALAALFFPSASGNGTLYLFRQSSSETFVRVLLIIELAVCAGGMIYVHPLFGSIVFAGALLTYLYYYLRTKKEFGGITGDTEGYFVLVCEGVSAFLLAAAGLCMNYIAL